MLCNSVFCVMLIRNVSYFYMECLDYFNMVKLNLLCVYVIMYVLCFNFYVVFLYYYVVCIYCYVVYFFNYLMSIYYYGLCI